MSHHFEMAVLAEIVSEVSGLDADLLRSLNDTSVTLYVTGRSQCATVSVYLTRQAVRVVTYARDAVCIDSDAWFEFSNPQCIENAARHVYKMTSATFSE